ncbi:uncharacterized protein PV07_12709, partial [Cladophialophora immunda]
LTHVLSKVESFCKAMEAKYKPILNTEVPIQKYAQLLMSLMVRRMYVMILHRYLNNISNKVPEGPANFTIQAGLLAMENAMAMEQIPELRRWKWYNGAYQQWDIALLLLTVIINQQPTPQDADRIWNVIDFVFEPELSLSRTQRAGAIIAAVRDRTAVYRDTRRIWIPVSMKDALDERRKSSELSMMDKGQIDTSSSLNPSATTSTPLPNAGRGDLTFSADQPWICDVKYLPLSNAGHPTQFVSSQFLAPASARQQSQLLSQSQSKSQLQPQQTPPWIDANQASRGQHIDFNNPSDSGTNDSWPPLITTDGVNRRTILEPDPQTPPPLQAIQPFLEVVPWQLPNGGGSPFGINSGFSSDQINILQFQHSSWNDIAILDIDGMCRPTESGWVYGFATSDVFS